MTAVQQATVDVFWTAFTGLDRRQRALFLNRVLNETDFREDLMDLAMIESRRHEPARSFRDYDQHRANRERR
jgi:hypothetical protein